MMSNEVIVGRTIAASLHSIWPILTDVRGAPTHLRSVVAVEPLTDGAYARGTRWRETRSVFGQTAVEEVRVLEVHPPHRVVLEAACNGGIYRLEHTLTRSGDHTDEQPRTHIESRLVSVHGEPDDPWMWRVLGALGLRASEEVLAQDLADLADAVEHPETQDMVVVHRLFTRELGAGPDLVRGVRPGDRRRAGIIADHLAVVLTTLVDHHHGEDVLLWPLLAQRTVLPTELSARLNAQHEGVHAGIDAARRLLTGWREQADPGVREELAEVLTRLSADLREHLAQEERDILPLVEQHLTRSEYDRLLAHGRENLPKDKAALLVQMILDGASPAERAHVLSTYPTSTQLVIKTVGARQYRHHVRRLRSH